MIFITQPRVGTAHNEILALQYAAKELGWEVYPAETSWRLPDELIASGKRGIPYGSQLFCETIAQQMGWTLKANSFDWLAKLPERWLKRKVEFMTLGEAKKITERKFIKPADDKCFDAKIYEPGTFKVNENISDDYPTLVSDVVQWDLEYRFFIKPRTESIMVNAHSGGITTWSNYIFFEHVADPRFWDMRPENNNLWGFVDCLTIDLYRDQIPTVASVVDVGRIVGKGWAVIETNPAWASGIYGCDPIKVLETMKDSCE